MYNNVKNFFLLLFYQYLTTVIPYDEFGGGPSTKVLLRLIESKYSVLLSNKYASHISRFCNNFIITECHY